MTVVNLIVDIQLENRKLKRLIVVFSEEKIYNLRACTKNWQEGTRTRQATYINCDPTKKNTRFIYDTNERMLENWNRQHNIDARSTNKPKMQGR